MLLCHPLKETKHIVWRQAHVPPLILCRALLEAEQGERDTGRRGEKTDRHTHGRTGQRENSET